MTIDQNTPLTVEQRDDLIKLHEYDELIFGGFICTHCTPDDCDDPDDNVYWPCQPLRDAGVTDHEAVALIKAHRADIEHKAAVRRVRELLADVARLTSERDKAVETATHMADTMAKVGPALLEALRLAAAGDAASAAAVLGDVAPEAPEEGGEVHG